MTEKPKVQHAGCGALVAKTGEENGLPILICASGHRLFDQGELTPRGSVFVPDRRFVSSLHADIRTARA